MSRRGIAGSIALAAILASLAAAAPGEAAFPGKPGRIAFTYIESPDLEIGSIAPGGAGFVQLTGNAANLGDAFPSYSPDGRRILLTQTNNNTFLGQILIMGDGGADQIPLTSPALGTYGASFAPDGESFAYVCKAGADDEICAATVNGAPLPNLTANADNVADRDPVYARDGSLYFDRQVLGEDQEIWVRRPDGTEQQLTNNGVADGAPDPSPDGRKVTFFSAETGNSDVFVMNADGSGRVNLTGSAMQELSPVFSPTGAEIAFSRDGVLMTMPSVGGSAFQVTATGIPVGPSDWQAVPVKCGGKRATQVGTSARDTLVGTAGKDVLAGLGGKDKLRGKRGNDVLCGGGGRDRLIGGGGRKDRCIGGKAADKAKGCEKAKGV